MAELVPATPEWWVKRLYDELQARQPDMQLHRDLVDDVHALPDVEERTKKFLQIAGMASTNLCGLVIEATAERMEVEGFRFGDNPDSDKDAWDIWQHSDFDAGSAESITHALVYGRSFISVDPDGPRLLGEDPRQVIVAYSSDGRRDRLAALKVFRDEWTGVRFATLYLPTAIYKFRDTQTSTAASPLWVPRGIRGELDVSGNPLGEVPFFELRNRPLGRTRSEIANLVIPQRRLNQAVYNTDSVAEHGAFRQKWATNIEVPRDPATGLPVSPFSASASKMFIAAPPDGSALPVQFGNFDATDLSGYLKLGQEIAAHIARISRVPITYFLTDVSNISADALALLVSGLVKKCQRRVKGYEPAFEGAMRLAFKSMGDARAVEMNAETRWASMETRSVAQDADAAVKLTQGENPVITPQTAQERYLGMSQTERDRDQAWRADNRESNPLTGLSTLLNQQASGELQNAQVSAG